MPGDLRRRGARGLAAFSAAGVIAAAVGAGAAGGRFVRGDWNAAAALHGSWGFRPLHVAPRVAVRELWATRGGRGSEFQEIGGMAEAPGGEVWVSDPGAKHVVRLSAAGSHPRVLGRRGGGPGEFASPSLLAPVAEGVAVYDFRPAVEVFAADGRPLRRVALQALVANPKGFAALPGGGFVLAGGVYDSPDALHRFGADGRLEANWYRGPATDDEHANRLVAGGPLSLRADGSLLFSRSAPHQIVVFRPDGRGGRVFAEDRRLLEDVAPRFSYTDDRWRYFRWWYPQSRGVFTLPDGRILNVIRNSENGNDYSLWEVYAPDGRRLTLAKVGRAYDVWAMARDGTFLASYRDPATDERVAARLAVSLR